MNATGRKGWQASWYAHADDGMAGSPADRQERRQVDKQDWRQVGWYEEDRKRAGETDKHAERKARYA